MTGWLETVPNEQVDTGPLSIENEDYSRGQRESVALAVTTLRQALLRSPAR